MFQVARGCGVRRARQAIPKVGHNRPESDSPAAPSSPLPPACPPGASAGGRSLVFRRSLQPCRAGFELGMAAAHLLQQEVTVEGVLHVSVAQAGTCLERFGDIDTLGSAAPPLPSLEDVLAAGAGGGGDSQQQALNEACCLATPAEAVEPNSGPLQGGGPSTLGRLQGARTSTSSAPEAATPSYRGFARAGPAARSLGAPCVEAEGAAAAYQYTSAALESDEALQASEAIRRQRRRALIRLLRGGRSTLASLGSSLSSLASWDDAEQQDSE